MAGKKLKIQKQMVGNLWGRGIPTTPPSQDPGEGGGDAELQPGQEDGGKPIEVVTSTCRLETLDEDQFLTDFQPM